MDDIESHDQPTIISDQQDADRGIFAELWQGIAEFLAKGRGSDGVQDPAGGQIFPISSHLPF
jgi:hypothetical protein